MPGIEKSMALPAPSWDLWRNATDFRPCNSESSFTGNGKLARVFVTTYGGTIMTTISRQAYAEMFGPTTGDRVRLADTELWIEVKKTAPVTGTR